MTDTRISTADESEREQRIAALIAETRSSPRTPETTFTNVYRYTIPVDGQWHEIELAGPVVHVATRSSGVVEFWSLANTDAEARIESFAVVGTGHPARTAAAEYVGTAIAPGGQLVWHLFRKAA